MMNRSASAKASAFYSASSMPVTMEVSLALPGHRFTVIALDGNPVPTPASVDVLKLDVAERADVIVEMNNPGVWIFGSADDMDRNMGMGVVIEYENQSGEPYRARAKVARGKLIVNFHRTRFEVVKAVATHLGTPLLGKPSANSSLPFSLSSVAA